jgi:hypothetical protein
MTDQQLTTSTTDQLNAAVLEAQEAVRVIAANVAALETAGPEQRAELQAVTGQWIAYADSQVAAIAALAPAALAVADEAIEQRDAIAEELAELTEALEHMDYDHPLVSSLIESVEESVGEHFEMVMGDQLQDRYDEGYSDALNSGEIDEDAAEYIVDQIVSEFSDTLGISLHDASSLLAMLRGTEVAENEGYLAERVHAFLLKKDEE